MAVPASWTNRTLRDLRLRHEYGVAVIAVHDVLTDQVVAVPDPDAPLKDSDTLMVAGREEDLARVAQLD